MMLRAELRFFLLKHFMACQVESSFIMDLMHSSQWSFIC